MNNRKQPRCTICGINHTGECSNEQYRCVDCGTLFCGSKGMNFELCRKCSEGESIMNNQKQQALDALSEIERVSAGMLSVYQKDFATLRNFVESVESVDLVKKRKKILDMFESGGWDAMRHGGLLNLLERTLNNAIPDTLNTSCRCEELEKQVKHFEWLIKSSTESFENALDERDKHISELQSQLESETLTSENRLHSAETFRNELEYSRRYGRELQSQLEAERAAHAETTMKANSTVQYLTINRIGELKDRAEFRRRADVIREKNIRITEIEKQLEAERAAHAETRAKLEELENDYNELSERYNQTAKQLEAASAYIPKTNPCMLDDFGNMTSVESCELPTKAERLEEMQRVADYVNNGATSEHYYVLDVVHSEDDETIEFKTAALGCEHVSIGKPYGYKPDPVAPADGEPVYYCLLDCGGSETIGIAVSTGEIRQGKLSVYAGTCLMTVDEWRVFSDRSNHSPGWKR